MIVKLFNTNVFMTKNINFIIIYYFCWCCYCCTKYNVELLLSLIIMFIHISIHTFIHYKVQTVIIKTQEPDDFKINHLNMALK